jgi:putative ABC transport system substrate-binding protein
VLDAGNNPAPFDAFRDGLRDLGYVEGENLFVEYRNAEGNFERLPAMAAELVDLRVEVIVARDTNAVVPALQVTSTIPIVVAGGNVIASELVVNFTRPEGNITGVSTNSVETVGKWVELLKETVPSISRLAVVRDPASASHRASLQVVERAAPSLQFRFTPYDVRALDQLPGALATARAEGADGLLLLSSSVLGPGNNPRIGGAVAMARLPAVAEGREFPINGGLLAHGTVPGALARRAAGYVDKLLKGAKPADLPIELPTEFNIVVSLKAARELGITIPESVLARATEVIQ